MDGHLRLRTLQVIDVGFATSEDCVRVLRSPEEDITELVFNPTAFPMETPLAFVSFYTTTLCYVCKVGFVRSITSSYYEVRFPNPAVANTFSVQH